MVEHLSILLHCSTCQCFLFRLQMARFFSVLLLVCFRWSYRISTVGYVSDGLSNVLEMSWNARIVLSVWMSVPQTGFGPSSADTVVDRNIATRRSLTHSLSSQAVSLHLAFCFYLRIAIAFQNFYMVWDNGSYWNVVFISQTKQERTKTVPRIGFLMFWLSFFFFSHVSLFIVSQYQLIVTQNNKQTEKNDWIIEIEKRKRKSRSEKAHRERRLVLSVFWFIH